MFVHTRDHQHQPLVAVAMSGGVDSSVTAAVLLEQGYPVIGVTMWLPTLAELQQGVLQCSDTPSPAIREAQKIAAWLGIRHEVIDLRPEFYQRIIRYFCEAYAAGRTPNPCVWCNPQIKFGRLFEQARQLGAEMLATGHYAGVRYDAAQGRYVLLAAENNPKDQSYFLHRLSQAQLSRTIFPVGHLTKDAVRAKAQAIGLDQQITPAESQGNCFLADQRYHQLFEAYFARNMPPPGPITDTSGKVLGEHQGIHLYTVGQRKGLVIALGAPRYVVELRPETNTVVIGEDQDLYCEGFTVRQVHWSALERLSALLNMAVKVRYRNAATPALMTPGQRPEEVYVTLTPPKRAVTPGQSAVFYEGHVVLGGGVIETVRRCRIEH